MNNEDRRGDDRLQDYRLKVVEEGMKDLKTSISASLKEFTAEVRLLLKERDQRLERLEREMITIKATAAAYGTAAGLVITFIAWLIKQYGH